MLWRGLHCIHSPIKIPLGQCNRMAQWNIWSLFLWSSTATTRNAQVVVSTFPAGCRGAATCAALHGGPKTPPPWVLLLVCFAFMLLADCKTKVWSSTYNKKCNAGTRFWSYSDERNMREWGQSLNILLVSLHAKAQVRSLRGCWTSQRKRWQTRTGLRVSPLSGKVATCSQITSAKQNCNYNPYWPQRKVSPETFPHL